MSSSTSPPTDATTSPAANLTPSAASMLQVLLPSLTKLDDMVETVWSKQDELNSVLDRLTAELEQFDELVQPDSSSVGRGQQASQKLKDSRARIANVNVVLKRVRTRLDNVSMLAQAKILQNQQQQQQ
ncbi:hypothetical protein LPJ75_002390 [Coemansia sp. RSA 2598]|nr:hypothetical protein LPJ75_002390 [Coemansia sp. RSA 2598]